jgi:hypothetical protein
MDFIAGQLDWGLTTLKKLITVIAGLLIVAQSPVAAGPFGIDQGQSKNTLDLSNPDDPDNVYALASVPKPHPLFTDYSAEISATHGVCRINAGSEIYRNDRYGTEVQRRYKEIENQLTGVYGSGTDFKYLRDGALWKDPDEWVMSLYQSERTFSKNWAKKSGAKLKDGIAEISLSVNGLSSDASFIVIQYFFENLDLCDKEESDIGADAL